MKVVLATATWYPQEGVRSQCAIRMADSAQRHGYRLIVVDGGSTPGFLHAIGKSGAIIYPQITPGMGPGRKEALIRAKDHGGDDPVYCWLEPEKYPIVTLLGQLIRPIRRRIADITIPDRGDLASYPEEQRHAELFGNEAFKLLTGHTLDMWSGVRVMSWHGLQYFLDYEGEYGNLWDQHFVPVMRAIAAGLEVLSVPVDYIHPPEQTAAEAADPEMILKRLKQLDNLIPAIHLAALDLGMLPRH